MCLSHHPVDVVTLGGFLHHELLDLRLQLSVGPFQRPHLVQVVGQPVIEALHRLLLAGAEAVDGEAGAQHVEAVPHRHGPGQRQRVDGGQRGDMGLGAKAASTVPHRHTGKGGLSH